MSRIDTIFEAIFLIGFVIGTVIRKIYTAPCRHSKAVKKHKSAMDAVLLGLAGTGLVLPLVYLFTPWLDFADYDLPAWLGWIGAVVFAGAIVLLWRSHVDLGHNWSPTLQIRPEHSLITHGVYRHIRHPMYTAHLLWAIAQGLLLANWLAGWIFFVTSLPLYLYRIPKEEQMMLDQFGDEYRHYKIRSAAYSHASGNNTLFMRTIRSTTRRRAFSKHLRILPFRRLLSERHWYNLRSEFVYVCQTQRKNLPALGMINRIGSYTFAKEIAWNCRCNEPNNSL